jgi:uncharacterized membrane protein YkoI
MNTAKLRSKRIWIPTLAAVVALGVGGTVWASSASADLGGSERDRVVAAAKDAAGPGDVISAESKDRDDNDADDRNEAYEVELRKADGTEVEVVLDKNLKVLGQDSDARDDRDDRDDRGDRDDVSDDANGTPDADDRALSATERSSASKAAIDAVGGGTVTDLDASDDPGVAYEVDVRKADGTYWDVDLDSSFGVVGKTIDR